MTFIHLDVLTPIEMEAKTDEETGKRVYLTPEGNKYPSVTTVIGSNPEKMKGIMRWRKRVGEEKANAISKRSTARGTKYHSIVEDYIDNCLDITDYHSHPLPVVMFKHSKPTLDRINKIYLQEAALYSDVLKLAGRVDCIAEFDGLLSIIDFKTAAEPKKQQYLYDYFVQECAYACMLKEKYDIDAKQLVTIVVCENGETQVEVRPVKKEFLDSLLKYKDEYDTTHGKK
tara:strand:- start:637 stop:1323 length:687 start_codon:yes stop_codon:yes gene_type:complete